MSIMISHLKAVSPWFKSKPNHSVIRDNMVR